VTLLPEYLQYMYIEQVTYIPAKIKRFFKDTTVSALMEKWAAFQIGQRIVA
jgi:hypothetical protein